MVLKGDLKIQYTPFLQPKLGIQIISGTLSQIGLSNFQKIKQYNNIFCYYLEFPNGGFYAAFITA